MGRGMTGTACSTDWPSVSSEQELMPKDGSNLALLYIFYPDSPLGL